MIYDLEGTRKLIMGNIWNVFLNTFLSERKNKSATSKKFSDFI